MNVVKQISLTVGVGAALACSTMAYAQTSTSQPNAATEEVKLEEIIVTAERRESNVQKAAVSVSVLNGDALKAQGKTTLAQILEDVPNVAVSTGSNDTPGTGVVIRGAVGPQSAGGSGVSGIPSTAVYTDGIYSGIGGNYDIDRVEVLRGPQGTLYGRSATGGVVSTYTRNPALGEFSADLTAEYGSYSLLHETAVVNLPVTDDLAVRIGGNQTEHDGYYSKEGGWTKSTDGRVKALFKPSEDFSLLVGAALQNNSSHSGGSQFQQIAPNNVFVTNSLPVVTGVINRSRQYWGELNVNVGLGTLTYLPAYRTYYEMNPGAPGACPPFNPGPSTCVLPSLTPTDKFMTHELRLASSPDANVTWQIGGLYYDNHYVNASSFKNLTNGIQVFSQDVDKQVTASGLFGEANMPLSQDHSLRLTTGLRYDYSKVENTILRTSNINVFAPPQNDTSLPLGGAAGMRKFHEVNYKVRLEKDITESNLIYASISTGFVPGDVQVAYQQSTQSLIPFPYDAEKLTAYEVGSKNRFLDNRLQLNGAVFFYDYSGYQTTTFSDPGVIAFDSQSSPAQMYGGELDLNYQLTDADRVGASMSYTNAKFVDKSAAFAYVVGNEEIAGVPPFSATVNYGHDFKFSNGSVLGFKADARYFTSYLSNNLHSLYIAAGDEGFWRIDSQFIANASGTWTSPGGKYSLTGYIRNIDDNRYKLTGGGSGAITSNYSDLNSLVTKYTPRTLGVVVQAHF